MTSDPEPLKLTFGLLKRASELMPIPDGVWMWVEQRQRTDADGDLLHALQSIGIRFDASPAGYARSIVTIGH